MTDKSNIDSIYVDGSTINISIVNLKDFRNLIDQATKEADALRETIHRLETFRLGVTFTDESK